MKTWETLPEKREQEATPCYSDALKQEFHRQRENESVKRRQQETARSQRAIQTGD
ncbi:MAG: hypothetical protein JWN14_288 [Chthonomonadales bacterium]|nr:hypothetical protein [Chthonomonadales bacterium]